MAELAAGNAGTQTVVADTDRVVLVLVRKVIPSLGHGTDKHADALLRAKRFDVISDTHHGCVETQGDLPAVWRKVVRDGVLDDFQQLLLRVRRPNRESVQKLDHQTGKSLEGARNTDRWADFDENALGSVDINLQLSSFIDRGIEKRQQTLAECQRPLILFHS